MFQVVVFVLKNYIKLEKKNYYPFLYVVCNYLFKGAWSSWALVAIVIVGEIQAFVFIFWIDSCLRIWVLCCRMACPQNKLKRQGNVTIDNQQVNVVAIEEEIEVEQKIIIYTPTFEGRP